MSCSRSRTLTNVSRVKVEENGRAAVFVNEERLDYYKVKVDGGVVSNDLCADYVVCKPSVGSVVVELKGTDVEHAVDQIDATITLLKSCKPSTKGVIGAGSLPYAGLVVCARFPRSSTMLQKKLKKFVSKHRCPLHCVSGKGEFKLERVLEFSGPK